jgi:hypothetical protein
MTGIFFAADIRLSNQRQKPGLVYTESGSKIVGIRRVLAPFIRVKLSNVPLRHTRRPLLNPMGTGSKNCTLFVPSSYHVRQGGHFKHRQATIKRRRYELGTNLVPRRYQGTPFAVPL